MGDRDLKYDQKVMDNYATNLEQFLNLQRYIVITGLSQDEYDKSIKVIKKAISNLRKGKGKKVFNQERYMEVNGSTDNDE